MIPILPVKNLAPVKPLLEMGSKEASNKKLLDQLKEITNDCLKRDKKTFEEIAETTEITSNFIQGKQIWQRTSTRWVIAPIRRVNPNQISSINTMQFYCTENLQRLVSSNPDLEPAEHFKRIEYKDKVKKAAAVWNGYEKEFYTAWFNHQEALHSIVSGTYIESVQYDHLRVGAPAFQEIWGETEIPISEGMGVCFECGFEGKYEDFMQGQMPQCPQCGSYDVAGESPVKQLIPTVQALQPVQMGDLSLKLIPIQACRFDIRGQAEDSSYFIERMRIPKGKLELALGKRLKLNDNETTGDRGLESIENIARAGNTLYGQDNSWIPNVNKGVPVDRVSLMPEEYQHIVIGSDEETVSGDKLEKKQKLVELAPHGLTMLSVNNFEYLIGLYPNIHHKKEIASGVYHMRLGSGVGRGSEDVVELQKRFNRNDAQMLKAGEIGATPASWFIEGAVDRRHVKQIGKPDSAIPIKQAVAEALGRTDLVGHIPHKGIAAEFFQYTYNVLDKYRQMAAHAPDVTNNLTGANRSGTATEARISDANAEALYGPMLQIKAQVRARIADLTIRAYNEHFKGVSKYFSFGTTSQDIGVGEYIKGEDIDPEIHFVVVKDSQRPKTRNTQQSNFAAVMQMAGGAQGLMILKESAPDLLDNLLKTFDLELDISDYDTMEDLCSMRLQQAIEFAKTPMAQHPQAAEILLMQLQPRIRPTEPGHPIKAQWYSEFLDTPHGIQLDESARDMIDILITAHVNGGVISAGAEMAAATAAQTIGQSPAIEAQTAMQDEQMAEQAQMQQQQQAQQMEAQVAEKMFDADVKLRSDQMKIEAAKSKGK